MRSLDVDKMAEQWESVPTIFANPSNFLVFRCCFCGEERSVWLLDSSSVYRQTTDCWILNIQHAMFNVYLVRVSSIQSKHTPQYRITLQGNHENHPRNQGFADQRRRGKSFTNRDNLPVV